MDSVNHPCFNFSTCKTLARVHLPVAPECNIQCSFCNRDYDCINESRPGVTSKILTPKEAFDKFKKIIDKIEHIAVVGFAGPGDPLANWQKVKQAAGLIKTINKNVSFCLSTNGLMLPKYVDEIIETGFSFVTVTINAVSVETAAKIYTKVDVQELLNNQINGLKYLVQKGITCKVNTLYLPGVNDEEIEPVARRASECGAYIMNLKKVIETGGADVCASLKVENALSLEELRNKCTPYIKQMLHCKQCRADSVGLLEQDRFREFYL